MGSGAQETRASADTLAVAIALSHKAVFGSINKTVRLTCYLVSIVESQALQSLTVLVMRLEMAFSKRKYEGLMG